MQSHLSRCCRCRWGGGVDGVAERWWSWSRRWTGRDWSRGCESVVHRGRHLRRRAAAGRCCLRKGVRPRGRSATRSGGLSGPARRVPFRNAAVGGAAAAHFGRRSLDPPWLTTPAPPPAVRHDADHVSGVHHQQRHHAARFTRVAHRCSQKNKTCSCTRRVRPCASRWRTPGATSPVTRPPARCATRWSGWPPRSTPPARRQPNGCG